MIFFFFSSSSPGRFSRPRPQVSSVVGSSHIYRQLGRQTWDLNMRNGNRSTEALNFKRSHHVTSCAQDGEKLMVSKTVPRVEEKNKENNRLRRWEKKLESNCQRHIFFSLTCGCLRTSSMNRDKLRLLLKPRRKMARSLEDCLNTRIPLPG